jgi:hypothetical protein
LQKDACGYATIEKKEENKKYEKMDKCPRE